MKEEIPEFKSADPDDSERYLVLAVGHNGEKKVVSRHLHLKFAKNMQTLLTEELIKLKEKAPTLFIPQYLVVRGVAK